MTDAPDPWRRLADALTRSAGHLEAFLGALERGDARLARRHLDASRQERARSQRLEQAASGHSPGPSSSDVSSRIRAQIQRISLVDGILPAVLPSLTRGPDDADAFVDAHIAPTWDLTLDLVLLIGAAAARHAGAFRSRGYQRVLVVLGKGEVTPAGVPTVRVGPAFEAALLALRDDPPERFVALGPGASTALKGEVEQSATFLLQAFRHEVVFAERWGLERVTNALRNLPILARSHTVGDYGAPFAGRAALIVCPGPSLDGCLDLLAQHRDRFIVFAVNHVVRNLTSRGLCPDFVLALDPAPILYDHLAGLDLGGIAGLIVGASVTPPLVALPTVRRVISANLMGPSDAWIEPLVGPVTPIETGGTVAHAAAVVATRWGCNPIVFVGQDLAFRGSQMYANETVHAPEVDVGAGGERPEAIPRGIVAVKGWRGERLLASTLFDSYRQWYERWIATRPKTRFINCSEGGARIAGMHHAPLREVVGTLPQGASNDVEARLVAATREQGRPEGVTLRALLQDRVARLEGALARIAAPDSARSETTLETRLKAIEESLSALPEAAFAAEASARRYRTSRADSATQPEARVARAAHLTDLGQVISALRAAAHDALSGVDGRA